MSRSTLPTEKLNAFGIPISPAFLSIVPEEPPHSVDLPNFLSCSSIESLVLCLFSKKGIEYYKFVIRNSPASTAPPSPERQ